MLFSVLAFVSMTMLPLAASGAGSVNDLLRERLSVESGERLVVMQDVVLKNVRSLGELYDGRGYDAAWVDGDGLRLEIRDLLAALKNAAAHGLSPRSYQVGLIEEIAGSTRDRYTLEQQVDIELLLSSSMLALAGDLLEGRARRTGTKDSSFIGVEETGIVRAVGNALDENGPGSLIEELAPASPRYLKLQHELARLREMAESERLFRLPGKTLHPGDEKGEIAALRRRLAFLGDLPEIHDDGRGVFDTPLQQAVRRFQQRHGLETDGVVGAKTRAALEVPLIRRVAQIELSLERWRWLPRDPGVRYMVVNIAGQELEVMENGRTSLFMRVIVGLPFMRTPSFASNIDTVVLNPYWEVPHSIAINEILPKLRQDTEYLARENMEVLKRGGNELVDTVGVDWETVPARGFPYRFRQKPGPDNALGKVKFLMPNSYSVYLHDTPAKTLFSRARRCFSHGCVRLEKPLELAELLLHDEPGWSFERVHKTLETERNYRIRLSGRMPVYLLYFTAWVDGQGVLQFRDDVYGRDETLGSTLDELDSQLSG